MGVPFFILEGRTGVRTRFFLVLGFGVTALTFAKGIRMLDALVDVLETRLVSMGDILAR